MKEIIDSTKEACKERLSSPFYGYFFISWLLINWNIPYSAFFLDEVEIYAKLNLLQDQYLYELIYNKHPFWLILDFFVLPIVLTYLFVFIFPPVTRFFYREYKRNKFRNVEIDEEEERKSAQNKKDTLETNIALQKTLDEAEKVNPRIVWKEEYKVFKKDKPELFKQFNKIVESIYEQNANIKVGDRDNPGWTRYFEIPKEILVYADVNGLLNINHGPGKISLTPKGKYFLKLFTAES